MTSKSNISRRLSPWTLFFLGVTSLAVVVTTIAWWIYVAETTNGSHAMRVERFLEPFPTFLHNALLITLIQLAFSGVSFIIFYESLKLHSIPKALNITMLWVSGLISFWLLFTLMWPLVHTRGKWQKRDLSNADNSASIWKITVLSYTAFVVKSLCLEQVGFLKCGTFSLACNTKMFGCLVMVNLMVLLFLTYLKQNDFVPFSVILTISPDSIES